VLVSERRLLSVVLAEIKVPAVVAVVVVYGHQATIKQLDCAEVPLTHLVYDNCGNS